MAKRTTVAIPKAALIEKIRKEYPNLTVSKITQACVNAGAEYLSTADESTLKDALLKA